MEDFLKRALRTKFVGKRVVHYCAVTSTMEVARRLAQQGAPEGTIVIADEQTMGRGRLGRTWLSPKGSLALSIIFCPPLKLLPQLIMITSLAAVNSIRQFCGLKPMIKWPNDILIGEKKVCGILIDSEVEGDLVNFAIAGIGMNVNLAPASFPEISNLATSLSQEVGKEVSLPELTIALLTEIEQLYIKAQTGVSIHEEWRDSLETLGKWVRVKVGGVIDEGKAESVGEDGSLLLRHRDGSLTRITSGDVTVLKD